MTRDELLQRYAAGERDFTQADLLGQNFDRCELSEIILRRAQLRGCSFQYANLSGADLSGASLEVNMDGLGRVNLKRANLANAKLSSANLGAVLLQGANLSSADLTQARLCNATLIGANLTNADLNQANLSTNIPGSRTSLQGAVLRDANFSKADLTGVLLDGADIERTTFTGATMAGVTLPAQGQWPTEDSQRVAGDTMPFGATWIQDEKAWNFALYSKTADTVHLLLYSAADVIQPLKEITLDYLQNRTGRVWHIKLSEGEVGAAVYYAYRVNGPASSGNRFEFDKILLDPYAKAVYIPPAFDLNAARAQGSNAGRAILSALTKRRDFDWDEDRRPRYTSDLIIYEMHVRGFTMRDNSGIPQPKRGTYAGVIEKIPYLKDLGVTAVELLPVYHFQPAENGNYWGYMPLAFFVPHPRYSSVSDAWDTVDEFRSMVKALHKAGIEVILDVVYNHSAELGPDGPCLSFRGIDNAAYYLLTPDLKNYRNDAGTGNVLRTANAAVRRLVVDSLRYWVNEMHVDGFRFDLASIFTRRDDGSVDLSDPPILAEISSDPDLRNVRLIAEPWDLATYQLGRSFPGLEWMQWNGRFRDNIRGFIKSDPGLVGAVMAALYGSDELFPDRYPERYRPFQSVNFITCHDGFCLYDLVAYNQKHNEDNGEDNRDGSNDNRSWNCGWEGDIAVPPETAQLRKRQIKNFATLLLLANGTPMICSGDEFMNTQGGNNNPYNQDNTTTWLNWDLFAKNRDVFRFFKQLIAFRKRNSWIAPGTFWRDHVQWFGPAGSIDLGADSHAIACKVNGPIVYFSNKEIGAQAIYVMINTYWEKIAFTVQAAGPWYRFVDTSLAAPEDLLEPGQEIRLDTNTVSVQPRSIVVLVRT